MKKQELLASIREVQEKLSNAKTKEERKEFFFEYRRLRKIFWDAFLEEGKL